MEHLIDLFNTLLRLAEVENQKKLLTEKLSYLVNHPAISEEIKIFIETAPKEFTAFETWVKSLQIEKNV